MAVHDKVKWHLDGDFTKELPIKQSFVQIDFYPRWIVDKDLAEPVILEDFSDDVAHYRAREISGPRLLEITDGVLDDQLLSEAGARFTAQYYGVKAYYEDYSTAFSRSKSTYHVEDTPENYEKIRKTLNQRYEPLESGP